MNDFRNHIKDWYNFLWNCTQVNAKWSHWQLVNMYSDYGLLLLSGSKLLPGPMLTKFYVTIWSQIARFIGPTWGPSGSCWPSVGRMLAPWTTLEDIRTLFYWIIRAVFDIILCFLFHSRQFINDGFGDFFFWFQIFCFHILSIFIGNLAFHEDNVK